MHFARIFILSMLLTATHYCKAQQLGNIVPLPQAGINLNKKNLPAVPFLKVNGNILYDFSYRSYVDTPFVQGNVTQQLVQSSFNFLIKGIYPLRMTLSNRSSNAAYFKNLTDVNVQFSRQQLMDNIKENLRKKTVGIMSSEGLSQIEEQYKHTLQKAQELQEWVNNPARIQELVEEKEKLFLSGLEKNKDTLRSILEENLAERKSYLDSALQDKNHTKVAEKFAAKQQELEKLKLTATQYAAKIRQVKSNMQDSINSIKREINSLKNAPGLFAFMKKSGMAKDELTKAQRLLLSINQVGLGRGWVDYSELTVKNISLTGINIEMNPMPFYFAFAAGKINYRFRDFIIKNNSLPDQSLYLARIGVGQKEKNNLIVTFYNGKKSNRNYSLNNTEAAIQRVLGISAEARIAINENNYIITEIAKSSFNGNGLTPSPSSDLIKKAFNLKIHHNEAYSIKLFSQNPQTNTRFTAYYKKTGENFQSFNLYPININQDAWLVKVNQQLWKKRVALEAAVRKNDFVSPIAAPSFTTKTIFTSLQVSLRVPKYPFILVGYYPSSQLSLSSDDILMENQYNTLNAVVSHNYQLKNIGMNTNAVLTKFYNHSSDTAFIYFNASTFTINHSIFLSPLVLQTSAAITQQHDLNFFMLEQLLSYQFKENLTVTGGVKWNRLNNKENMLGGTAGITVNINKLGTIQMNYDKTYLPAYNKTLKAVDMGRASFYRAF